MRRNKILLIVMLPILSLFISAQDTVLASPKSKNPDRVIKLTPLFEIKGESSEGYFLKDPGTPLWPQDGDTLILPDQDQLLLFDKSGKFLRNVYKKGEGPGEWGETQALSANYSGLALLSGQPNKCLFFDLQLAYLKELRFDKMQSMMSLIQASPQGGTFFATDIDFAKIKTGTSPFKSVLKHFDKNGQIRETPLSFDYRVYSWVKKDKQSIMVSMEMIEPFTYGVLPETQRLLLACRETYRLDLIDLGKEKGVKSLIRKFERQAWRLEKGENRPEGAPARDFFNDIQAVTQCGNTFWVFTSKLDEKKGVLVDVISAQGEYLDRFCLPLPGLDHPKRFERSPIALSKNRIAWIHKDDEDNPMVSVFALDLK